MGLVLTVIHGPEVLLAATRRAKQKVSKSLANMMQDSMAAVWPVSLALLARASVPGET